MKLCKMSAYFFSRTAWWTGIDVVVLDVFQEELNQNPRRVDPLISLTPIAIDNCLWSDIYIMKLNKRAYIF